MASRVLLLKFLTQYVEAIGKTTMPTGITVMLFAGNYRNLFSLNSCHIRPSGDIVRSQQAHTWQSLGDGSATDSAVERCRLKSIPPQGHEVPQSELRRAHRPSDFLHGHCSRTNNVRLRATHNYGSIDTPQCMLCYRDYSQHANWLGLYAGTHIVLPSVRDNRRTSRINSQTGRRVVRISGSRLACEHLA